MSDRQETPLDKAWSYLQQGQWEKAYGIYHDLLTEQTDDIALLQQYAIVCAKLDKFDEAHAVLQRAITQEPRLAILYATCGNLSMRQQYFQEAADYYQQALQLEVKPHYHHSLANAYRKLDNTQAALEQYHQANLLDPSDISIVYDLASLYLQQGALEKARSLLLQTLNAEPTAVKLIEQLAYIYCELRNLSQAHYCYERLIELQPRELSHYNNLAACLMGQQHYQEALTVLADALAFDPDHTISRMNMALCFMQLDRFDQAIYHYQLCEQDVTDNVEIPYNLGVAFMQKGRLQESIQAFKRALQADLNHIDALNNLAACYLRLEQEDEALSYYRKVNALQPDNKLANYAIAALTQEQVPDYAPSSYVQGLFDNYASYFDTHASQGLAYQVPKQLAAMLQPYRMPNARILDCGCGTGLMAEAFQQADETWVGFDLSHKMLELAQTKERYQLLCQADLLAWPLASDQFDMIIAADVLVYIGELRSFMYHIVQTLRDGGLFAFSCETCQHKDYHLLPSGRFAHRVDNILNMAQQAGLKLITRQAAPLRQQQDDWLHGEYIILMRDGS